jgi:hypothetical protein
MLFFSYRDFGTYRMGFLTASFLSLSQSREEVWLGEMAVACKVRAWVED